MAKTYLQGTETRKVKLLSKNVTELSPLGLIFMKVAWRIVFATLILEL